jgi:hypothetical protein
MQIVAIDALAQSKCRSWPFRGLGLYRYGPAHALTCKSFPFPSCLRVQCRARAKEAQNSVYMGCLAYLKTLTALQYLVVFCRPLERQRSTQTMNAFTLSNSGTLLGLPNPTQARQSADQFSPEATPQASASFSSL